MKSCNSISVYDKSNNMVMYKEFAEYLDVPKCFYSVSGNKVNRIHINEDNSVHPPVYESVNSFIEFDDNIMLYPLRFDNEIRMEIVKSASTYSNSYPGVLDRFDTYKEFNATNVDIESFRIKSNLIDDCLNRL
jgi:hypothetical protein